VGGRADAEDGASWCGCEKLEILETGGGA